MKLSTTGKIVGGLAIAGLIGYVGYNYLVCPPLTIFTLNPIDGSGTFQFGKAKGAIAPGGYDGGWGWTLSFSSFQPQQGWTVHVTKNGVIRKATLITMIGTTAVV